LSLLTLGYGRAFINFNWITNADHGLSTDQLKF